MIDKLKTLAGYIFRKTTLLGIMAFGGVYAIFELQTGLITIAISGMVLLGSYLREKK